MNDIFKVILNFDPEFNTYQHRKRFSSKWKTCRRIISTIAMASDRSSRKIIRDKNSRDKNPRSLDSHPSITVSFTQSTPLHPAVPTDLINRLIIPGTVNYSYDETADTGPNYRVHTHTRTVYFSTGNIQGRDRDARVVTADRRYGKDERAASVEARTAVIRALHTATPPLICITSADAASTWIFTGHL